MIKLLNVIVMAFMFISCSKDIDCLDIALENAGDNKGELLKVLNHFKDDTLKLRAARFLIENMSYHYHYEDSGMDKYLQYFRIYSEKKRRPQLIIDSLRKTSGEFDMNCLTFRRDIESVDSALLVNNIDWAFKVWHEQPWGGNISFDDFCEYILPYSIGNEPLTLWRENIYKEFNPLLDSIRSLPEAKDPFFAGKYIIDKWETEQKFRWTGLFPQGPHIGPLTIKWKAGSCREFTDGVIYILRALGIPCGTDKTLMRGDNNASHFWAFVLDKDRNIYTIEPGKPFKKAKDSKIMTAKVHRTNFSINRQWLTEMKGNVSVYPVFLNSFLRDVTYLYNDSTLHTLSIPPCKMYNKIKNNQIVYLCSSNRDRWIPVDFGFMKKDGVEFREVAGGVVFTLGIWEDNKLSIISDPFIMDKETGKMNFYKPLNNNHVVNLYSKFSLFSSDPSYRMVGGVIEGSVKADFSVSDTLYLIERAPHRMLTTVFLNSVKSYKYVRYKGAKGSFSNISELSLYKDENDTILLKGKVIGTPGCWDNDGSHEYTNVFDGDLYTSFDYKYEDGGWAALQFDKPQRIVKIVYSPRHRDNFIRSGDCYELFFWKDGKWSPLGKKTAVTDELKYNAPLGALFLLRNYTRGKDERIFEIRNNEQVFL